MATVTRKQFIRSSGVLLAAAITDFPDFMKKRSPLLSFSTLGCPDWPFRQIVEFAAANGYQGLEMRGILRQLDLTRCPEFSAEGIKDTLKLMKDNKLRFTDLGSSCTLHIEEPAKRREQLAEGKRFIDLARQIDCPNVRVFPNSFPKDRDKSATIELIAGGLRELGDYARGKNVMVLMETHGDAVHSEDLVTIMQKAGHEQVGLIWDVCNMWTITKEPTAEVYARIRNYIHHTHIKDARLVNGKVEYTLLGQGEVPIFDAIDLLVKGGYKGYYSFEWEKMWHPELAAPELAIADFPLAMKKHFR